MAMEEDILQKKLAALEAEIPQAHQSMTAFKRWRTNLTRFVGTIGFSSATKTKLYEINWDFGPYPAELWTRDMIDAARKHVLEADTLPDILIFREKANREFFVTLHDELKDIVDFMPVTLPAESLNPPAKEESIELDHQSIYLKYAGKNRGLHFRLPIKQPSWKYVPIGRKGLLQIIRYLYDSRFFKKNGFTVQEIADALSMKKNVVSVRLSELMAEYSEPDAVGLPPVLVSLPGNRWALNTRLSCCIPKKASGLTKRLQFGKRGQGE